MTSVGLSGMMRVSDEHGEAAAVVARSLQHVQRRLQDQVRSDLPPVRELCTLVEKYHGKMLRPSMVLLSGLAARSAGAPLDETTLNDAHHIIGAVVEMIHLATLVHDDVLDEADTRRRSPTVNRLRGNEPAVILGDYLFSTAFHLCASLESQASTRIIGAVATRLCEGELLQLHHRDDYSLDEPTYYEIVERKTASLIAASCDLGALHAGASDDTRDRLRRFGLNIGIAFQIQDDLLDLTGEESVVGKSVGKDLEKGKMTLPLIHHLRTADPLVRGQTLRAIEHAGQHDEEVSAALDATGSFAYAREAAVRLVHDAKALLQPGFDAGPQDPALAILHTAADAVVARAF
ncbi:MAG: polyprenyl synthetase family protein [Phycisphaerales bacterium]